MPKLTFTLLGIIIVVFIIQNVTDLWVYFAFYPILALHMPWMFLTSIFLHAGFSHLIFNMFALLIFGSYLERMVSSRTFITIFLISGILGNVGYMITATDPRIPAVGASGAIYGIMGALAILAPYLIIFIYGIIPVPIIVAAFLWALLDFFGLFLPTDVAHGAHLMGLFIGIISGLLIRLRRLFSSLSSLYYY
ncbi:MAG: rhomboid family intramembrane serine protease [Nitrososphaerota archaeon]|nr:rhomboid family intramembrane serine protease [Nitrososphaerales archaeon]MDW8044987.1 rhomboid family intramembrane serine protease [Nitrososphaerota archaeon]